MRDKTKQDRIQAAFERFHKENPHVLDRLLELTDEYLMQGHSKVGIGMLFEVLRWTEDMSTTGDAFKLNNNYRSRYVRLMLKRRPDWADVFSTRELVAA
jgi:hypothetical protein